MATPRYASGFNSFVPEVTGQVIAHVRNPNSYKYNQYVQLVPTPATVGVYHKLHVDDVMRLGNLNETVWEDGGQRPNNNGQDGIRFVPVEFATIRQNFGSPPIGWKAERMSQKSGIKLLQAHTALARNKAQMNRTARILSLLQTSGNWPSTNTGVANTINGGAGKWDVASSDPLSGNYLAIKKTLDYVARTVFLKTNGQVGRWDTEGDSGLNLILAPDAALLMSETSEIHDYIARSQFALDQIRGKKPGQNALWGLPDQLYGWNLIVEDAVRANARPTADGAELSIDSIGVTPTSGKKSFQMDPDSAIVVSRVGGLDGEYGAPSFSTVQLYYFGSEMELETEDVKRDRRTMVDCVIDDKEVLAAGASGFLITDILT